VTRKRLSGRRVRKVARQFFRRLTERRQKAHSVQAAGFLEWRRTVVSSVPATPVSAHNTHTWCEVLLLFMSGSITLQVPKEGT
jgi:hypothetical protein